MAFREIDPREIDGNVMKMIGTDWMLIGAKQGERVNMMTASWGSLGWFWARPIAVCVIRRERFTHPMVDGTDTFSLTFFDETYREQLNFCGKQSGRDYDKVKECGFTTLLEGETPYFEQAKLALICRKVAKQPLLADAFLDPNIVPTHYSAGNFHDMYFGEITKALVQE